MKSFTVRLANEEYQLLQNFCAAKERSMNDVLRELVRNLSKLSL